MPKVKDITGELGKLSKHNVLPKGQAPVLPQVFRLERKLAFNGPSLFCWTLIGFFLVLQLLFLIWLGG
ncbi:MAG: hypothetical protein AB3N64_02265 [Puniceicoccaceae bacterium]